MKAILVFVLSVSCLFNLFGQKKMNPEKLISDFDYLIEELRLQHQGLYEYLPEHEVNKEIDSIRKTLNVPKTKLEFYRTLRYTLGLTNEAHTSINLPKLTMIKIGLSKSFLPLAVKFCDKALIITQNYGKNIVGLNKGSKLISVNGEKISDIITKLFPLIPTDGFNETSRYEWTGGINFSLLYRLIYGKKKKFKLEIQEFGSKEIQTINISPIIYTKFKGKNAKFKSADFDYTHFALQQINDSVAYLCVPSFSSGEIAYESFYRSSFKKIDSLNIKHLIIDVQANDGGTEGNENLLFSYLTDSVIQKYKRVTMLPKPYSKNKHDKDYQADKWKLKNSLAERGTFTLFSNYYSDLEYHKPNKDHIFKGNVYVLISGTTFSGGAEFASLVKMSDRGVFIGDEAGGAYEGNVSGYSESIKLPNSKIQISIPTVHFQVNVNPKVKGSGVIPDYEIPQTWEAYLKRNNRKKDFAIELITKTANKGFR